jgi:drug/metabolite transporter (DMT)-like permease
LLAGFGAACWGISTVTSKGALEFLPPLTLPVVQLLRSHLLLWTVIFALFTIGGAYLFFEDCSRNSYLRFRGLEPD